MQTFSRDVQTNAAAQSLTVQFSRYFLKQFSNWFCALPPPADAASEHPGGLLFGSAGPSDSVVQNFRPWPAGLSHAHTRSTPHEDGAFAEWCVQLGQDSDLTWLDLLGWFSIRPALTGELLPSDVAFHNAHFPEPNKLAAIFHSAREEFITADLYAGIATSPLHLERHRRVSLHLALDQVGAGTDGPAVRPKMNDDLFLRAYDIANVLDRAERRAEWKEKMRSLLRFEWMRP